MKHIIAVLSFLAPALIHADNASLRAKFSKLKIQAVFPDNPTFPKLAAAYNQRFTYVPTVIVLPRDKDEVASTVKIGVIENLPGKLSRPTTLAHTPDHISRGKS